MACLFELRFKVLVNDVSVVSGQNWLPCEFKVLANKRVTIKCIEYMTHTREFKNSLIIPK